MAHEDDAKFQELRRIDEEATRKRETDAAEKIVAANAAKERLTELAAIAGRIAAEVDNWLLLCSEQVPAVKQPKPSAYVIHGVTLRVTSNPRVRKPDVYGVDLDLHWSLRASPSRRASYALCDVDNATDDPQRVRVALARTEALVRELLALPDEFSRSGYLERVAVVR